MKKIGSILILVSLVCSTSAQDLLTNQDGTVAITGGVPFVVEGNIFNSGTIFNEGDLRLSGDWNNSGNYHSISGTFALNGNNQMFEPGASSYSQLTINSSGIVVTSDLTITNSLELTRGIVSIASGSKILLTTNASVTGNEDAYIDGALFTASTGDFTFPVGTEFEYLPISLVNIQAEDSVGVRAFSTQLNASISNELENYSPNRYWEVIGSESFTAEGIELPLVEENFLTEIEEAVIAFADPEEGILNAFGVPSFEGTLTS